MQATVTQSNAPSLAFKSRMTHLFGAGNFWLAVILILASSVLLTLLTRPAVTGPIHVDEWTNLAYAESLAAEQSLPHSDPIFGQSEIDYRPETGFRVFLVQMRDVTGLNWISLFPLLPAAMGALFAVTALALGASLRTGLFAGVLAVGTPTTLRFLGPEYVVPVSLGLTLATALAIILIAPKMPNRSRLIGGSLLMGGLVLVHPPTALVALIFVAGLFFVRLHETGWRWRTTELKPIVAVLAVPAIWFVLLGGDLRSELLGQASLSAGSGQGLITEYLSSAGYLRLFMMSSALFFLLSSGFTAGKIGLVTGLVAALGFTRAHEFGIIGMANLYDRSWLYVDLLLVVGGGAGLAAAIAMIPEHRLPISRPVFQNGAVALVLLIVVIGTAAARSEEQVYRVGEADRVADFDWIQSNLGNVSGLTLIDPDIANGYPAIAGRPVFASSAFPRPSAEERVEQAWALLATRPDAAELADLGIGIIYRPFWSSTPGITEVKPGVYVVDQLSQSALTVAVAER